MRTPVSDPACRPAARYRRLAADSRQSDRRQASGALSLEIEKRQLDDRRSDPAAPALDRPLDGDRCAETLVLRGDRGERDRLLEDRAPTVARDLADLTTAGEHGDRRAFD